MKQQSFNRAACWASALPALILFVPLLLPMLTGRLFAHGDLAAFHLPLRRFYSDQLVDGNILLWSSHLFQGFYVHAEGQVGMLHPLHLLLYRFMPLVVAFNIETVLSYAFAFAGMWLFLRRFGLSHASRTVGAMAFGFSGFYLLRIGQPNALAVTAHLPWLLLAIDLTLSASSRARARGAGGIAALVGSQVLLGYPQYIWFSFLACALYLVCQARDSVSLRRLWLPALASIVGIAIGGIQLVPTLDLLNESQRAVTERSFRLTFSLHPLNLVQLWSPYALPSRVYAEPHELYVHEFAIYNGSLSTLGLVWVLLRRDRLANRRAALFGVMLCLVGIVLALGRYGGVYVWLAELPLLRAFRGSARHVLLIHLGLAILVALSFEDLLRSSREELPDRSRRRWLLLPLVLSAITAVIGVLWWYATEAASRPPGYPLTLGTGLAIIAIATTLMRDAARGVKTALLILPTFLALDLGVWCYSYVLGSAPLTLDQAASLADGPPTADPGVNVHDATGAPTVNCLLLRDARVYHAYVGLYPRRVLVAAATMDALRVGGVEWLKDEHGWHQVDDPMPRVRVVADARVSDDPAADLANIDVRRTALVDRPVPTPLATAEEASARILADKPGRLELEIDAEQHALLAITESFHSGWQAERDGARLQTLRVYGDYLGVVVEPGRYRLVLTFRPESFRYGAYLTMAGLVGTFLLVALVSRRDS